MFHGTSYQMRCLRIRIPKLLPHLWYKGHDISDAKPNMKEMTSWMKNLGHVSRCVAYHYSASLSKRPSLANQITFTTPTLRDNELLILKCHVYRDFNSYYCLHTKKQANFNLIKQKIRQICKNLPSNLRNVISMRIYIHPFKTFITNTLGKY